MAAQSLWIQGSSTGLAQQLGDKLAQPKDFSPRKQFLIKRLDYDSCTNLCISKLQWQMVPAKPWKVMQQETQQQVRYHKSLIVNDTVLEKSLKSLSSFYLTTHKQRETSMNRKWENAEEKRSRNCSCKHIKTLLPQNWKQPQTYHNSQKSYTLICLVSV